MAIGPGTRVGPYEVVALIGEGGMGQVYRATDTNLKRTVAIKVLSEAVATDADRLARFQREAEVLARLNHPNIAQIHGLERSEGAAALVMELIEGPTLEDRLAHGLVPLHEAIPIAKGIAAALEAAHEQGIVHRDLKPANIKVREDGTVKVLDFGLAKAMDQGAGTEDRGPWTADQNNSPTITSPAMTAAGIILGTAAYMSPEQARAKPVDKRTDVWAFGCVFYEMVTGRRAFAGDDVSEVLASVLAREPDWTLMPPELSPTLSAFIKRCLHKDRRQRVRDIGDLSLALDGAFDTAPDMRPSVTLGQPLWRRALAVALTAAAAVLFTGLAAWSLWPSPEPRATTRFSYGLPAGQELAPTQRPVIAVSRDGSAFAYQAAEGWYLRSMGDLDARLITASNGSRPGLNTSPFFSPDGQWLAYWAAPGELKKVAVNGAPPITICAWGNPLGASWSPDNTILLAQREGIMRVAANGGNPELLIQAREGEELYGPQLMPDGRSVLFSVTTDKGPNRWNLAQVVVQSLSSGQRTIVVQGGSEARYLPTGHLLYALRDTVLAIAFDADRLTTTGGAVPLFQGVQQPVGVSAAGANYAVSDQGTLVYVTGSRPSRSLVWVNRSGDAVPIASIPPGSYQEPRLSPNGDRVLVTRDTDIWIYELASGRNVRLTRDGSSQMGVWDPTAARIAYSSASSGNLEAWVAPADGSGQPRRLTNLGGQVHVDSWSPDGKLLTLHHHAPDGPVNAFALAMDAADPQPQRFLQDEISPEGADFSPDGRYIAYLSIATGQREIYVRPYPGPEGRVPVSVDGGREPMWAANGDVFYRSLNGERMFAVSAQTAPKLGVGTPMQLFQGPFYIPATGSPRPQYDVSADGQRFLMLAAAASNDAAAARSRIVVVQNWIEELKRLVPIN
jgi:serine/threonine-protein kinase